MGVCTVYDVFFRANFDQGLEKGGAFAVYHNGELVVDLYGGFANELVLQSWTEDTVTKIYSTSKAIGGIVMAMLVDRWVHTICKPN